MAQTALVGQIAQESILICSIVIKGQVTAGFKCHGGHTLYHVISQILETSPLQTLGVKIAYWDKSKITALAMETARAHDMCVSSFPSSLTTGAPR